MDWRDTLDPTLKEHFNDLLKRVQKEKAAYTSAKNISQAQLWTAIALLMKDVSDLQLKIKNGEKQKHLKNTKQIKKSMEKF